jgi:hypothetical protein
MRRARWVLLSVILMMMRVPAAWSGVQVDVRGGDEAPRRVVQDAVKGFGGDLSGERMEQLLASAGAALVAAGWGNGAIEAHVDTLARGPRVTLKLDAIRPTRLARWGWEPADAGPTPTPGLWVPARAREEIESLLEDVRETGRPFASIQITDVSDSAGGLTVRAHLLEGARILLASAEYEGRGITRASYLDRVTDLRRGEPIRPDRAERAVDQIERTGLFASVEGPWIRVLQENQASLVYRMRPIAQNRAEGAVGYDGTSRNLSGFLHVDLGNLFGTGRRLGASWDHYRRDRSALSLTYREPFLGPLPIAADLALSQRLEDTTWTADLARIGLDGDLGGGLRLRLAVAGNRTIERGESVSRIRRTDTILGLSVDRRRDLGTRGSMVELEVARGAVRRAPRLDTGEGTLVRLLARGEHNLLFGRRGQLRLGVAEGILDGPDSLPRADALPVGGGTSLRGYPEDFFLARRYVTVSFEAGVRILPEGNRVYAFTDAAWLRPWNGKSAQRPSGYGLGLRIRGAGGWVRLDYGVPAGEGPLGGRIHFRLETRF